MDLKRLRYFIAVADLEHFGKASQVVNVVQPALTRQIRQLEDELGVTLFDRSKRGVTLTDPGRHFLRQARDVVATYDRACAEVKLVAKGRLGALSVGFIEVTSWHGVVPNAIKAFRQSVPEVQLILHSMTSVDQLESIRDLRLDCGFLYNGPGASRDLGAESVAEHRVVLAVPQNSPFASRQSVSLRDLSDTPLISFNREQSTDYHDSLISALERAQVRRNVVYEAENESIMLALVNSGMGVALVNEGQMWRVPSGVVMLPVRDLQLRLRLGFYWNRSNSKPTVQRFREVLSQARLG